MSAHVTDANALSPTKWARWLNPCRFAFRADYGDAKGEGRVTVPPTFPQKVGTCAHGALDALWTALREDGGPFTRAVTEALTADAIHAQREATDPAVLARVEKLLAVENLERLGLLDVSKFQSAEEEWSFDLAPFSSSPSAFLSARGRFDRVDFERSWSEVTIHEFKTGQKLTGPLEDDPQALLYLAAMRAVIDEGEDGVLSGELVRRHSVNRIRFRQVWLALDIAPREILWTPELDARVRAAAVRTLEEIHAETEWRAEPGPACRSCAFVHACPAWTRSEPPPSLDDALPLDDLATRAVEFRTRAKVYAKRAAALEAQLAAVAYHAGPFVAGGRPVELVTVKGRRSGSVSPRVVADAIEAAEARASEPLAEEIAVTSWGRVKAALKGLHKSARAAAWAAVDVVAPRRASQRLVIGPLAGEDEDEDQDEAEESAEEAA